MHLRQLFYFLISSGLFLSVFQVNAEPENLNPSVTLYTHFRYSFNSVEQDGIGENIEGLQAHDNVSRFGLNGQLNNAKFKVLFRIQTQAFATSDTEGRAFKQRYFYAGLESRYGRLCFGRMTNAYKYPSLSMDMLYNWSHINAKGVFAPTGATYGLSLTNHGFTDNTLQYETPAISGFKGTASIHLDNSRKMDYGYIARISYQYRNLTIGGAYARQSNYSVTIPGIDLYGIAMRMYANWIYRNITMNVSVENIDQDNINANYIFTSSIIKLQGLQTDLYMSAGIVDSGPKQGYSGSIAAFYHLIKDIRFFTLMSYASLENQTEPKVFAIGVNYIFQMSIK